MNEEHTRAAIAILVVIGFFAFIILVLMGLVSVENPELAKFVGAVFGYLGGIVSMIFARYFREAPHVPPT